MRHPAFSIANPNRVRSLVGSFSTGEPDRISPRRRCRLPAVRRNGADRRKAQSAGCGTPGDGIAVMAFAGTGAAGEGAARRCSGWPARRNLSADLRDIVERTLA